MTVARLFGRCVADLPPKPFCPCDINHPEKCNSSYGYAHKARRCAVCGCPDYQHQTTPAPNDDTPGVTLCPEDQWWSQGQARASVDDGTACWVNGGCPLPPAANDPSLSQPNSR
jgi:hypothetical protein